MIGNQTIGVLYNHSGTWSQISLPGLPNIYPAMINNSGLIVGDASPSNGPPQGQVGFYITKAGKVTTFDFGDSGPEAMPGPKTCLPVQKLGGVTNVWGVNDLGWLCGAYFGNYVDAVGGYGLSIPFVGFPFDL
jgi:hypothetical protein